MSYPTLVLHHTASHFFCLTDLVMVCSFFFFFNDTATTEIYTLSLHDALPILQYEGVAVLEGKFLPSEGLGSRENLLRSEEHTSELQSQSNLVCRLLLEKKKKKQIPDNLTTLMYLIHCLHARQSHTR